MRLKLERKDEQSLDRAGSHGQPPPAFLRPAAERKAEARRFHAAWHHIGRRIGNTPSSADASGVEAADAGLRQADDLLSAFRPDAGGDSRGSDHHHPAGPDRKSTRLNSSH